MIKKALQIMSDGAGFIVSQISDAHSPDLNSLFSLMGARIPYGFFAISWCPYDDVVFKKIIIRFELCEHG